MARIKKFAPEQNLTSFQTFLVDDNPNSDYFRITEFKDTFTGGKNGFLIEGSEYLKESTEIKIEILDVNGDPIYYEPGNGIPEYYEGISKLIAVYIYEDTPIGLGKITILGELKEYDDNGVKRTIPSDWQGAYNVKWERTFQINKNLSNEDRVRFYRRPKVGIDEIVKPIFNKTPQTVTQTGQVDGLPLIPTENTQLSSFSLPTSYRLRVTDTTYWTGSVVGQTMEFDGLNYSPTITDIVNKGEVLVSPPYSESDLVKGFSSQNYSVSFPYIEGAIDLATALTGSFAKINITDMKTFVGDAARVKVFRKSVSQLTDYEFVQEIQLESNELLRDLESVESTETFYGILSQDYISNYWLTSSNDLTTTFNQDFLYNSVELDNGVSTPQYFFTSQSLSVTSGVEYNLSFNVRKRTNTSTDDYLKVYLSGSFGAIPTSQTITTINSSNEVLQKTSVSENILANDISGSQLYFEVKGNDWLINNISLRAAEETSFSPDEITFIQSVPKTLAEETFDFRFEFYDINNNYIPVLVEETKTFTGGNLNLFTKELTLTPNQLYFAFDSASAPANPLPPLNIFIDVEKRVITGSVTFTSGAYDEFGNLLSSSQYVGGVFPGLLTDRDKDIVKLNVSDFTGSRDDITVQYIEYTGEVEGVTDSFVISRVQDGKGGVNFEIRPYRGTIIKNKDDKELEIQAIRIDGVNEIILKDSLPQNGFSDAKLRVLSSSIDEITFEESGSYLLLSEASSSKFIRGLNAGLTGSGEIDYNARFNRDSIDGELTVFLMDNATSESILTSIILTDLQDGLDSGFVTFDADVFTINPRTQTQFVPQFSSVTGSFYKRGTKANPVSASIEIFPSMSINSDFVPEYWMYFVSHSKDETIQVTAYDENGFLSPHGELNSYVGLPASQSKQLLVNFTYTEPITSASVQVDHIFTIVPEGKPGDETVLFEVNPQIVNLKANSRGVVDDYASSVTDISLRQGARRLIFTGSGEPGTFTIASESISTKNIEVGLLHLTSSFGVDYTASLIVSESYNFTQLSGSITYPFEIRPYFTSSVYTQSFTQNFTKTLDGPEPLEIILVPQNVTLVSDEVEFISDYNAANTTLQIKEGSDYLINTGSGEPGTFTIQSLVGQNITPTLVSTEGTNTAEATFDEFEYPYVSASATYTINAFPYSLGPGHQFTSSVYERTQNFVKSITPPKARSVELSATSTTVKFDGDGQITAPLGSIVLTATAYNTSGSVYYGFFRDGFTWQPYSQTNTLTLASGDATEEGNTVSWEVRIKDGGSTADVFATDVVTITGVSDGATTYNVQLDNPSVTLTVDVDGGTTLTNSGATIRAYKGSGSLEHVTSYSLFDGVYDSQGNFIGNLGQYSASVHSVDSFLTQTSIFSGDPATIGDIGAWTSPFDNPAGSIVYKVDIENGRATYFLSQSFAASFEGAVGPGIVVRGEWVDSIPYLYSATRRDAVFREISGNTHYWATTEALTEKPEYTNGDSVYTAQPDYSGPPSEGDVDAGGWEYLGQEDFFVAAKIAIFEESFVKNTINVGSPASDYNVNPQITIYGADSEPYISIGQGTQGYGQQGIFLGVTEDGGPNATVGTSGLLSIEDDTGDSYLRWDGYNLEVKSDNVLIETNNLTIDSQNELISIGQGTTGYANEGVFIGQDGVDSKLSLVGTPVGTNFNSLEWDGSTLTIRGALRQTAAGQIEPSLRGNWADTTQYYINDSVIYNGQSWSSNTNHTSDVAGGATDGPPGTGPWTASSGTGKTVTLSSDSFVITYDANGDNPSPSGPVKLMASSSNFLDPYFKFTGGISGGDEATFTDGADGDFDSATFVVPSTIFTTPLQFRVGVSDGDQNEVVSDVINVFAIQPGADSSPMYSITPITGTQIKNGTGNVELQIQKLDSTGLSDITSGTDARIYKDDSSLLHESMSGVSDGTYSAGVAAYNPVLDSNAIDGTLLLELRDNNDNVLDTITLLDVTDGLGGGSFISPNLKTTLDPVTSTYAPSFLSITASFYSTNGTEYTQAVRITPNLDGGTDYMFYDDDSGAHTDPNGYITLTLDDGDGTVFSGTGIGNKLATKDVVITAEFTDPISNQTNTIVETVYIISDGADGLDAITVINTNQAHTLPAASDGTVSSYADSGTTIIVYEGTTKLDYDETGAANGTWNVSLPSPSGLTLGADVIDGNDDLIIGNHSNMSVDSIVLTYGISGTRSNGDSFTSQATQTLTKAKAGTNGTNGETGASVNIIFIRNATQPSTPSPSSGVPSGWSDSPPAGTDLLWASQGTKGVGDTNYTWGTPYQVEGTAVAEVTIYRLNDNTGNSGGSYNFTTSTLTPPTNWSATVPSLTSDGDIVYAANGLFSGAPTATAATTTWSTPVIYAQRTDGANGTSGVNGTDGAAGQAAGIVYAGDWKLTLPDGSTPNTTNKLPYLSEEDLVYVVKEGSNYYTCETTHRYCGTSTGGNVVGDVILFSGNYYIANKSTADDPQGEPADWDALGTDISPGASLLNGYVFWASFGAEFTSVATDILFAEDVYANRTVNIGTGTSGNPVIALNADAGNDYANPYISIGQGTQGFRKPGIFMGFDTDDAKFSISGSDGFVEFDGTRFAYSGVVTGSTVQGGELLIGFDTQSNNYNFRVTTDGNLFSSGSSSTFSGRIEANEGNFGDWSISNAGIITTVDDSSILLATTSGSQEISITDAGGNQRFSANTQIELPELSTASSTSVSAPAGTVTDNLGYNNTDTGLTNSTQYLNTSAITISTGGKYRLTYRFDSNASSYAHAVGEMSYAYLAFNIELRTAIDGGGSLLASTPIISNSSLGYDTGGGFQSVTKGTQITLADKTTTNVENLKTGDSILAWNEETHQYESANISAVKTRIVDKIYRVRAGGKIVDVSDTHGFYYSFDWEIKVQHLRVGEDEIYVREGNSFVKKVVDSIEIIDKEIEVYTLSVPRLRNYISNDIVSHNIVSGFPESGGIKRLPGTTLSKTINNLPAGTYYANFVANSAFAVQVDDFDYYGETSFDPSNNDVNIQAITAGTFINGGGFAVVADSTNYFRVASDDAKQYGASIGYTTDLQGGLAVDAVYGAGGFSPVAGVGGAYNVAGHPYLIKGAAIVTFNDSETGAHGVGTAQLSAGNFTSITGTSQGIYNVNITSVTAAGSNTSGKYASIIATGRSEPGGGGIGETAILGVEAQAPTAGTGQLTIYVGKPNSSILRNLQNLQLLILH